MSQRISKAEEAIARSMARLTSIRAEERDRERRDDAKRKILLGAALETMMQRDPSLRARVKGFMGEFLKRPRDIAAFSLRETITYFETLETAGLPPASAVPEPPARSKVSRGSGVAGADAGAPSAPRESSPSLPSRPVPSA